MKRIIWINYFKLIFKTKQNDPFADYKLDKILCERFQSMELKKKKREENFQYKKNRKNIQIFLMLRTSHPNL